MTLTPALASSTSQALDGLLSVVVGMSIVIVLITTALLVFRGRRHPNSRTRAIIDAGLAAIPGVIALVAGLVGIVVGLAFFVVLFFYWLIYVVVATIWVSIVGGHVTYPSEFGQLATEGGLYVVLGLVLSLAGIGWVALVVTRS
ncbi:MAG: hypothetical protein QOE92_891, partial [Chloroflexota bacterium]|nr:hypothetical protein [Chloroflexota bacterium]